MKRLLFVMACLVIPSLALSAPADSTVATAARPNSLHAGAWALEYSIGSGFYDSEVNAKRHFSASSALRLGLSFSTESASEDRSLDTTLTIASIHEDSDVFSIRLDLVLQHYPNLSLPAQFYFGVGPFVQYYDSKSDGRQEADPSFDISYDYSREQESFTGGVTFGVGAEWFASRAFSLFTEYDLEGGYAKWKQTRTSDPDGAYTPLTDTDETSQWFLRTGSARFGLGFYF